jgi:hypothetical protein
MRCRCRVNIEVRSDRIPSCRKTELDLGGGEELEGKGMVKDGPAAAA